MANAIFDAHQDDPEFGYRFLADEVRAVGHDVCDPTVWRICRDNGWWSSFGKPRRRTGRSPGTPAHDDLVRRNFTAEGPNRLWLADISEHPTGEGRRSLRVCVHWGARPRLRSTGGLGSRPPGTTVPTPVSATPATPVMAEPSFTG